MSKDLSKIFKQSHKKMGLLDKFTFGKYEGTMLCRVLIEDIYYLKYLIEKNIIDVEDRVKKSLDYELKKRDEGTTLPF